MNWSHPLGVPMNIRRATSEDTTAIAELTVAFRNHLERATPTAKQFEESIATLLTSSDAEFYVAELQEKLVGYVLQRYRYSMWICGIEATIEDLFVDPAVRNRGVGKSLVEYALQAAIEHHCLSICLDTNEFNEASTAIYTQLGFSAISKRWNGRQIFFRKPFLY
ncbi:MAG: GNAT family N-acetyltransferase [Ignavibacteriae bacterium]|nr:MAG: GNAT family N-acetyltransferase [Ignavibacteriota bacterium]